MAINTVEKQIVPDTPRSVDNQQLNVYVPFASTTRAGIAKYDTLDFIVNATGKVSLKYTNKALISEADPLTKPSLIKIFDTEFKYTDSENPAYPKAQIELRRDWEANNVFDRAALIKINTADFTQSNGVVSIDWPSDPFTQTSKLGFRFSSNYFQKSGEILSPILPRAHMQSSLNDGYGVVKIDTSVVSGGRYLQYIDGLLSFNEGKLKDYLKNDAGQMWIRPNYAAPPASHIAIDPRDVDKNVAIRKIYWKQDININGQQYLANVEVPTSTTFDEDTMYYRTELLLNKSAVGLSYVENMSIPGAISSHNTTENVHSAEFAKVVAKTSYASDIGTVYETSQTPSTVKQRIANIDSELATVYDEIATIKNTFLGYFNNPNGSPNKESGDAGYVANSDYLAAIFDPTEYDERAYLILGNTDTIWIIEDNVWVDSEITQSPAEVYAGYKASVANIEDTAANIMKSDGLAAYGTSSYWSPIDHSHPLREDLFIFKINTGTAESPVWETRKLTFVSQDGDAFEGEFDNSSNDIEVNIPYVRESEYLHNWNGDFTEGVPTFVPGTSSNSKFVKLWMGTTTELSAQFGGSVPSDVLTIITDDVSEYEGELVDTVGLAAAIASLKSDILDGTSNNVTYLFSPVPGDDFNWTAVDMSDYVPSQIPIDGFSFTGSGQLTFRGFQFITANTSGTDAHNLLPYYSTRRSNGDISIARLGCSTGAYITTEDLLTAVAGPTTRIRQILNHDYGYKVRTSGVNAGALGNIDVGVANLWSYVDAVIADVDTLTANVSDALDRIGGYPDMPSGSGSAGAYIHVKTTDISEALAFNKLAVSHIRGAGGTANTDQVSFDNATGGSKIATIADLSALLNESSRVHFSETSSQTVNTNSLSFWVGTKAEYDAIPAGERLANRLYICKE